VNQFTDFLAFFSQSLLIIALPIVIAAAIQLYRTQTAALREKLGPRFDDLERAARIAVRAAEQLGLVQKLAGPEKKQKAVEIVQRFLDQRGVRVDVAMIEALIESEVLNQFNNPYLPADTPEARQALVDRAIRAAKEAAEKSGMSGVITDVAEQKKAFAAQLATHFLEQLGISVSPAQIAGMIDSAATSLSSGATSMTADLSQTLIEEAVENGVFAAQQSSAQGKIENSTAVLQAYALYVATQFLAQHNLQINETLLSGLIEARLMRSAGAPPQ